MQLARSFNTDGELVGVLVGFGYLVLRQLLNLSTDPAVPEIIDSVGGLLGALFPPTMLVLVLIGVAVVVALASAPAAERSKVAVRVLELLIRTRRPPSG